MIKGEKTKINLTTEEGTTAMDAIPRGIEEINAIIDSIDESFDSTDANEQKERQHKRPQREDEDNGVKEECAKLWTEETPWSQHASLHLCFCHDDFCPAHNSDRTTGGRWYRCKGIN